MSEEHERQPNFQVPLQMLNSNMLFLTNPDKELQQLELKFRGKVIINDEIMKVGEPLMNEEGINWVMIQVRSAVSQLGIMGNTDEKKIPQLMNYFSDGLILNLMVSRGKYAMGYEARDVVTRSAIRLVYSCYMRSLNEGDRRFWSRIVQEVKQTSEVTTNKKGGLLSMLNPWKRRAE